MSVDLKMSMVTLGKMMRRIRLLAFFMILMPASNIAGQNSDAVSIFVDTEEMYRLTGTWKFKSIDNREYALPAFDDSGWDQIDIPGQWHMLGIKGVETAWYRRQFTLSQAYRNTQLSLMVPVIADAHELYFNGTKIGGVGFISSDGKVLKKSSLPGTYPIPTDIINYNGENTIALRVSDNVGWGGVVTSNFFIGRTSLINRKFNKSLMWNASISFVLVFLGIYYLILFLGRLKEKGYLYYSLFTTISGLTLFGSTSLSYLIVDNFWFNHFMFHSGLNILPFFAFYYVYNFFEYKQDIIFKFFTRIYVLLFSFLLLTPIHLSVLRAYGKVTLTISLILDVVTVVYMLFIVAKSIKLNKLCAKTLAVGGAFLILALLCDMLGYLHVFSIKRFMAEGFIVFTISMSIAMAFKFSRLYDDLDRYKDTLTRINKSLSRFVPLEFLENLNKNSILDIYRGDKIEKNMVILFSDIRSYTKLCEKMTPEENFDFINAYLERLGPVIRNHKGVVDKYIGDAIMALFRDNTETAVHCAIEMQREVQKFNEKRVARGHEPIATGIGLHKGDVMLGIIGEEQRIEGTVIADAVNLASRFEELTKVFGASIIISDDYMKSLDNYDTFNSRFLGEVSISGIREPKKIYEIVDGYAEKVDLFNQTKELFEEAIQFYHNSKYESALELFGSVLTVNQYDRVATYYVSRCKEKLEITKA